MEASRRSLEDQQYDVLKHVVTGTAAFGALPLIPELVALYQWLYDSLGHVLTVEDAAIMPMTAVFDMLM